MQQSINDMLTVTDPTVAAKGLVDRLSTSKDPSNLKEQFSNLITELKGTEQFKLEVVKKAQEIVVEKNDAEVSPSNLNLGEIDQQPLVDSFEEVKGLLKQILNEDEANSSNDLIRQVLYSKGASGDSQIDARGAMTETPLPRQLNSIGGVGLSLSNETSQETNLGSSLPNKVGLTTHSKSVIRQSTDGEGVKRTDQVRSQIESASSDFDDRVFNNASTEVVVVKEGLSNENSPNIVLGSAEVKVSVGHIPHMNNLNQTSDSPSQSLSASELASPAHENKISSTDLVKSDGVELQILTTDSKLKSTVKVFENEDVLHQKDLSKQIDLKSTDFESGAINTSSRGVVLDTINTSANEIVSGSINSRASEFTAKSINQQTLQSMKKYRSQPPIKNFINDKQVSGVQQLPVSDANGDGERFVRIVERKDGLGMHSVSAAQDKQILSNSRFTPMVADAPPVSNHQEMASQEAHEFQVEMKRVTELQPLQKIEKISGDVNSAKVEAKLAELGLVIKQAAIGRIKSLNITLKPVELGAVEVAIDDIGGEIHIKMSAEKAETLETLQRQESEMRQSLNQQNATFSFSQQNSGNKKFSLSEHSKSNETDDSPRDDVTTKSEYIEDGRLRITI